MPSYADIMGTLPSHCDYYESSVAKQTINTIGHRGLEHAVKRHIGSPQSEHSIHDNRSSQHSLHHCAAGLKIAGKPQLCNVPDLHRTFYMTAKDRTTDIGHVRMVPGVTSN